MGICDSKEKKPVTRTITTTTTTSIHKTPTPIYYEPKPTYRSGKSRGSYESSDNYTRDTTFDNPTITKQDIRKMKNIYSNYFMSMAVQKKTIGQGGQAKVKKYYSPKYKKYVVEKVIDIDKSNTAESIFKGFIDQINLLTEAILLSGCNYPNIVKIYEFKEDPPAIIMEYCAKGSLRSILNKKIFLHPIYKIYLIYSICDGLGYIHTKGIVHGDLKCDNILLSDEKKYYIGKYYYPIPKLADFGLSQVSPNKVAAGTPGFIAPEVYEGSGLNFKTDIFALGMVMFEILSGLRPLPSDPQMALAFFDKGMIPCTKEVLRKAWELRCEEFLPGIKNHYYDAFYTIMIKCIDDNPKKRPDIVDIFLIVKMLYEILKKVSKEKIYDESKDH
jgi:serine/threonine protein kinase